MWTIIVTLVLLGLLVWRLPTLLHTADTGTNYGARMGCSCRFVEGRTLESCERDFEPGMSLISLSEVEGERAVKASLPLLGSHTAHFDGVSCMIDKD